ncbi:hypothetical protein ADL27_48480 [Streptomyces sp. NRRL F-6602]|nr:hypothetical protein ADL27_48480 [Streptomyces sp. NRRL F-6602]
MYLPMYAFSRCRTALALVAAGALAAALAPASLAAAPPVPGTAAPGTDYPCTQYLTAWAGKTVRSTWTFHIDAKGRPQQAKAVNLSAGNSPRSKCEGTVGSWGGKGSDGGHLIAATLKGVSKRINLVPQRHKINNGIYKWFENGAKHCLSVKDMKVTNYTSTVHYPNATTVVPSSFTVSMLPSKKGMKNTEISLDIPNEDISVQKESGLKRRLNNGLRANGCPTVKTLPPSSRH